MPDLRDRLSPGVIVSLIVDEIDGFDTRDLVCAFACAAERGGAVGLRVEGIAAVTAVRERTNLPIVGFVKGTYPDGSDLVTPDLRDIEALFAAGADIVAVDATKRKRPNGMDGFIFFEEARKRFHEPLWADCAQFREGIRAAESGADAVATTLAGCVVDAAAGEHRLPDFELVHDLASSLLIPVIAEGGIWTPEDAVRAVTIGAYAVVVGSAITRPRLLTRMFVDAVGSLYEG
ncbi:MAG: putative N-acetylmannosamine-6-phosphate 2-epimerase [Bacteroidota bacterium]|nr:putative N-acetylmannosamine-6-phosphate 2-epimerase [Bacteroidota bacterium]